MRRIPDDAALVLLKGAIAAWETLPKVKVDGVKVFRLAVQLNLTAYDASYLVAAREKGLTLVTDDQKLRSIAKGISSQRYLELYP